ncbi:MAG: hypothetical protein JO115_14380 [Pseudonocardiales bacterium]|nr:hypothetical protein [Pseudonocardiales bacterium]
MPRIYPALCPENTQSSNASWRVLGDLRKREIDFTWLPENLDTTTPVP